MELLIQVSFKSYQRINCVENYNFKCYSRENKSTPSFLMFAHPFQQVYLLGLWKYNFNNIGKKFIHKIKGTHNLKDNIQNLNDYGFNKNNKWIIIIKKNIFCFYFNDF